MESGQVSRSTNTNAVVVAAIAAAAAVTLIIECVAAIPIVVAAAAADNGDFLCRCKTGTDKHFQVFAHMGANLPYFLQKRKFVQADWLLQAPRHRLPAGQEDGEEGGPKVRHNVGGYTLHIFFSFHSFFKEMPNRAFSSRQLRSLLRVRLPPPWDEGERRADADHRTGRQGEGHKVSKNASCETVWCRIP